MKLIKAVRSNNIGRVKLILKRPWINVNKKNHRGNTSLIIAVHFNYLEIVRLLLEKGANINCQGQNKCSPLLIVAQNNNMEILKLLLEKDIDVNIRDRYGRAVLTIAADYNHIEIVKLLLKQPNIDINTQGDDGRSPLYYASYDNYVDIEVVKVLLEGGANVNIEANNSDTPLIGATIYGGESELIKLLIYHGAKIPNNCIIDEYANEEVKDILNNYVKYLPSWNFLVHHFYPKKFRDDVFQWLLVCYKLKFNKDIKSMIITNLSELY